MSAILFRTQGVYRLSLYSSFHGWIISSVFFDQYEFAELSSICWDYPALPRDMFLKFVNYGFIFVIIL